MKTIEKSFESKVPYVIIDKSLDDLSDVVLFPEKVQKAKEIIEKAGLPDFKKLNLSSKSDK